MKGLVLAALIFSTFAHAATIEELQSQLYKKSNRSKKVRLLKLAYDKFQEDKFDEAIVDAGKLAHDRQFGDYASWLEESALRGRAAQEVEKKNFSAALTDSEHAIKVVREIEYNYQISPILHSTHRDLAAAESFRGDALWGLKKYNEAKAQFEKLFERLAFHSGLSQVDVGAIAHYAESCLKKKSDLCESWLSRYLQLFPHGSDESRAITHFFPDLEKTHPPHFQKLTQTYRSPDMDTTSFDAAMALYVQEKYSAAIDSYKKFLDDYPKSSYRYRARYWLASAFAKEKKKDESGKWYDDLHHDSPLTYYGLFAGLDREQAIDSTISVVLPEASDTDPFLHPMEAYYLKRAKALIGEKACELATMDLKELKPRDGLSNEFLLYLAMLNVEAMNYSGAFVILSELSQRGYDGVRSTYVSKMIFPVLYYDEIKKAAVASGIDPILILSLTKQESAFDPKVSSGSGAVGLMQLLPITAAETVAGTTRDDLSSPDTNIDVGTKYLAQLITKFHGNIILALAGYNAGPTAAERWYKENASAAKLGPMEFIETIPYKETREYVSAIIRNHYWYSKTFGEPFKPINYFWDGK